MYQRNSRRCCALMLAVSICLKLCMAFGLDTRAAAALRAAAARPDFARFLLFLESGTVPPPAEAPPRGELLVLEVMDPIPAPHAAPRPEPLAAVPETAPPPPEPPPLLPRALADASSLVVDGNCTYSYDKAALLARPSALCLDQEGPTVLIVHAHTSEAYTPEPGFEYEAVPNYRTQDPRLSVVAVGEVLAQTLEAEGISVIHDCTVHDYPDYNSSYWNALQTIQAQLAAHPSIQVVLDIHRDAVETAQGQALALCATQEGQEVAQLMLVVGTNEGGLEHPGWEENLANALKLQSVLEGQWPGLCRKVNLRAERFNQHAAPGSLLVEVGSNGNTLTQALASARLLGEGIAATLHALEQNRGCLP